MRYISMSQYKYFFLMVTCCCFGKFLFAQSNHNLNYFLFTAETNSPLLNDYNNQILLSKIDSLKLKAAYGYILTGEASAAYAPVIKGWGYDNALSNGQTLFAGARVVREFISHNNMQTRLKGINLTIGQIVAQKNISVITLKKQITDQYIATYSAQQQLIISQEIIHLLEQQEIVLKKLTQAAIFKQTDYLNFLVTMHQTQLDREQKRIEMKNSYALLNYLCGIADTMVSSLDAPVFSSTIIQPFDSSLYAAAYIADSAKLVNDASIITYDYKPKITGFADGGYQSSFITTPYKNFGLSMGVAITIPWYDGHKKHMLQAQNQIQQETRRKYYDLSKIQYDQQLEHLISQLTSYTQLRQSAIQQLDFIHTLMDANAKQLPTGDVKMVDYILSVNNLLNLKSQILQYDTMIMSIQNQLQYLILQ